MKLTDVLKKVTAGEQLSQEEKDFLDNYKPEEIPKSRLDAEIAKRKEVETKRQELEAKLEELTTKVESLESGGLSEVEKVKKENEKELAKLKQQLTTLATEKEAAAGELNGLKFKSSVSELAGKYNFTDPEYLGFKIQSSQLDLADETKTKEFMDTLKTASPKMFKVDANPGGGSARGSGDTGKVDYAAAKATGDKVAMIASAPEIK